MGWAWRHIEKLQKGETVSFRPQGNSMSGKIESGQKVTVEPMGDLLPKKGDIVLCKVNGKEYLHLVLAQSFGETLIGNNRGRTNGWTRAVYGRVVKVEE